MSVTLQIKEIERLAAAGVKIEINSIDPVSDAPEAYTPTLALPSAGDLESAVWDRWTRTKVAGYDRVRDYGQGFLERPCKLLASQHGDKVWVSVHPVNLNYEPFQLQDNAAIFPSDALMAQLALWEQHHK